MVTKKTSKSSKTSKKSAIKKKTTIPKKTVKKAAKKTVKKTAKKTTNRVTKKAVKKKVVKKKTVKASVKAAVKKTTKKTVKKAVNKAALPKEKIIVKKKIIHKPELKIKTYHLRKPIPEEKYFVFVNGYRVKNVKELAELMDKIEQEVFSHHVNPDRNDFYNWVKDVFDDVELAEKLLGVTDPKHLQLEIYKHITHKAFED